MGVGECCKMKVGYSVTLKAIINSRNIEYRSKVLELYDKTIFISDPVNTETNKTEPIPIGASIEVIYTHSDENVYKFKARVVHKVTGKISMHQLTYPPIEEHTKVQRREFVRVNVPVDAAIHSVNNSFPPFLTTTEDISAGGAALYIPKDHILKKGDQIIIWLNLLMNSNEFKHLKLSSKVVKIIEREKYTTNQMAVTFDGITESDTKTLLRFIFEHQIKQRRHT